MLKKIANFLILSCVISSASFAATEKPALFHHHPIEKSQGIKPNISTINPSFRGTWSGACNDGGFTYTLKVVINDHSLSSEESGEEEDSRKKLYALNHIDFHGLSSEYLYGHSIEKLSQTANILRVDGTTTTINQNLSSNGSNKLSAYIDATTYTVNNNQLIVDTTGNRFVDGQANGGYHYSCTLNKENAK